MNDLTKKALSNFANSAQWEIIKDGYLNPLVDEIKDVTKPFVIGDKQLDAEKSYYAKSLAAIKIKEIIDYLERLRRNENSSFSEDFE